MPDVAHRPANRWRPALAGSRGAAGLLVTASVVAALVVPTTAWAQAASPPPLPAPASPPDVPSGRLSLSGSVRVRIEALDNQFRPGLDRAASAVFVRSTLLAQYRAGPAHLAAEIVDARAYRFAGRGILGTNDVNAVELTQSYLGLDLAGDRSRGVAARVDIGRFTMDLGSRRLVGRNMFRNTINSFTGIRAQIGAPGTGTLNAFYTLPHLRLPRDAEGVEDNRVAFDRESFDLSFWGVFANKPRAVGEAALDVYVYGLHERDSPGVPTRDRQLYTPGARLLTLAAPGRTDFEIEAAYQFGTASRTAAGADRPIAVSAWFLHAELGHQFRSAWQPRLSARFDIASGDRPGARYTRFDTLFGVRRLDFGPTGLFGPLGRNNIVSPGVKLDVTPGKRWDGFIAYRAALLESATDSFSSTGVRDPSGGAGRFAGHQVETRARYWITPKLLRADVGGAVLINGDFLQRAANANRRSSPLFGYVDLTATF
ncbi:MAG: alginate export family protein [Sphingomonas sp.]|nr:alginate export family protein [Sphingomonas sp.]